MQGIQNAGAAAASLAAAYVVKNKPDLVAGGCVTVCGVKTSKDAWQMLRNADTLGKKCKSVGYLVAGAVTTSVGVGMMLTAAGWSPFGDTCTDQQAANVGCSWLDENTKCEQGKITLTCTKSNAQMETEDPATMCEILQHGMCKEGYLVDCRGPGDGHSSALHVYIP